MDMDMDMDMESDTDTNIDINIDIQRLINWITVKTFIPYLHIVLDNPISVFQYQPESNMIHRGSGTKKPSMTLTAW
jgi:hypothetical protein